MKTHEQVKNLNQGGQVEPAERGSITPTEGVKLNRRKGGQIKSAERGQVKRFFQITIKLIKIWKVVWAVWKI